MNIYNNFKTNAKYYYKTYNKKTGSYNNYQL